MKRILLSLALLLTLAFWAAGPTAGSDARAFRGTFTGSGIETDQRCPGALTLGFAVKGLMTHLGRTSGGGTNCTEFTLGTEAVDIWDGQISLVAADGSILTTTYSGGQSAPVAGVATFWQTHIVTGATGRFEDATGELTVTGVIDFTTLTMSGTAIGWISY